MRPKHIIILLWIISIGPLAMAQNDEDFYAGELSKMVNIPNSPEAEAFTKYGDHQVSLYSGVPNINVPLHTIKGLEFDLPVSLTYDASGIKVEQIATEVGLGWNLSIGGRISRIVNGLADDYLDSARGYSTINTYENGTYPIIDNINDAVAYDNGNGGIFPDSTAVENYFLFLDDLVRDRADAEPDYYSINAPGISGTMVLDIIDSLEPKVLNNPRIEVGNTVFNSNDALASITTWKLTGEDGTQYFFDESEKTHRQVDFSITNFGNITSEYRSSWVLTKIISANGKDTYEFNYGNTGYWKQEQQASSAESTSDKFTPPTTTYDYAQGTRGVTKYKIDQQLLNSVLHNGDTVLAVTRGTRYDLKDANDVALNSRVTGLDFLDLDGNTLKSVDLDNDDYFNRDGGTASTMDPLDLRLKLDSLFIKGSDNNTYQTYAFEYEQPDNVPARDSYAQDYFGYYNGSDSNSTLIPSWDDGTYFFEGADREPSTADAKIGLLKKITYPTKGYSVFDFEGHERYKTTIVDSTVTALPQYSLPGGGVVHDAALYTNSNNNYCLDHLDDPLIKFVNFIVPEAGTYKISYTGNVYAEAGIIYTGPSGGYNTYCTFFDATTVWSSTANGTYEYLKYFDAGKHKAMLVVGESSSGVYGQSASLKVDRTVPNTVAGNYGIGGLRIKEIRNYSATSQLATTKAYSYRDSLDRSTGRINYMPNLWSIQVQDNDYYLIRKAAYAKGSAPYVVYETVREIQEDANGNDLGYVEHRFYDEDKGMTPRTSAPFENNYFPSLKGGELKEKLVVAANGDLLSKQDVEYYETSVEAGFFNKGWVAYATQDAVQQALYVRGYNVGQSGEFYSYEHMDKWTGCDLGSYPRCAVPLYVSDVSTLCNGISNCTIKRLDDDYATITGRFTSTATVYGGVSAVRDTVYLKDASDNVLEVATAQLTEYESAVDYLPRRTTRTDSKGDVWETTHYYPKDSLVTGYDKLLSRNNLVAPMKKVTVKNPDTSNKKVSGQEVEYQSISTNVVLPKKIRVSKDSLALRDLGEFTYYTDGNLKTSKKTNGPEITYIWGYDDRYPVAKVENATYGDVEALSEFGTNFDLLGGGLSTAQEAELRGLSNTMVTTYTYDPLVGVTSITDPSGNTITYVYDDFNRLMEVRDADNNLVTDHQYHYKGQ